MQNIKCIRPSNGAPPIYFEKILDKIAPKKFNKGDPLKIADIKNII